MNSESELIKALSELVVTPDPVTEYRLYYDETGAIIMCMMQGPFPDTTNFVVVTKEQYEIYWKYKITNGKLEFIPTINEFRVSFVKSNKGFKVVKNHASLLIEANEEYSNIEHYDTRNN
jgi:hypothetical protein